MTTLINTPIRPRGEWGLHEVPTDTRVELRTNRDFIDSVIGKSARRLYTSRDKIHAVNMPWVYGDNKLVNSAAFKVETVSLAVQAIHQSYAAHVPFSMRPDTFWYMIVHEVAEHIRQNPGRYAQLFTDTPEAKQTISVAGGDLNDYADPSYWANAIPLIRPQLEARTRLSDADMEMFMPKFSTSTPEDETALLVAFMNTVSPYFGMEWRILCGIPQIRMEGDADDWMRIYCYAETLASEISGLRDYFVGLLPVLEKIAETAGGATPDEEFWRSIYQYDNGCGEPTIGGWITAFFAHALTDKGPVLRPSFNWGDWRSQFYTDWFPSHISTVPVSLDLNGDKRSLVFAAGVTGVDYDDTFLSPRLGFAVAEV